MLLGYSLTSLPSLRLKYVRSDLWLKSHVIFLVTVLQHDLSNLWLAITGGRDKTVIGVSSAVGSSMGSKNWGGGGARPIDFMLGYNVDT